MLVSAKYKYAKFAAQKGCLVADQIRGLSVERALNILEFSRKRAAKAIKETLNSAIANAENNEGADIDELYVSSVVVDQGPSLKRYSPRAKGRADVIKKRMCHITISVSDKKEEKR